MNNKFKKIWNWIKDVVETIYWKLYNCWENFKFNYHIVPKQRKAFWDVFEKINERGIVHWDLYNSIVNVVFAHFICYYEKYGKNNLTEKHFDEQWKDQQDVLDIKKFKEELISAYKEIHIIYKYISKIRKENENMVDSLFEKIYGPKCDPKKSILVKKVEFNDYGKIKITTKTINKSGPNEFFNLDEFIEKKDEEVAQRIIELRKYMIG